MEKIRNKPYTPWFQPDYDRAATPPEFLKDFQRRHLARIWQGIPSIERTHCGTQIAAWYSGGNTEGADNFLVLSRQRPGEMWQSPVLIVENIEGIRTFDPCLWIDPDGHLHLFWAQAHMFLDGREGVWEAICGHPDADELAFSSPRRLCDGIMLNKPTVLSNGLWCYTVARCRLKPFHKQNVATVLGNDSAEEMLNAQVYASADCGITVSYLGQAHFSNSDFYEHMLYERKDGSLRMLARSRPELLESISLDGGKTWSAEKTSGIPSPCSRFFIRRMPSGRMLMVGHETSLARDCLCAFLSEDDGKTWPYKLLLDARPMVSYPDATIDADGRIRIIYDRDRYHALEILTACIQEEEILCGHLYSHASYLRRKIDCADFPKAE